MVILKDKINHLGLFKTLLLVIILIVQFSFIGCSKKKIVNQDKFVKIYSDLVIAQDTTGSPPKTNEKLKKEILKRYNVSNQEYRETIAYYNKNPKEWDMFFKKVIAYVDKLKKKSGT